MAGYTNNISRFQDRLESWDTRIYWCPNNTREEAWTWHNIVANIVMETTDNDIQASSPIILILRANKLVYRTKIHYHLFVCVYIHTIYCKSYIEYNYGFNQLSVISKPIIFTKFIWFYIKWESFSSNVQCQNKLIDIIYHKHLAEKESQVYLCINWTKPQPFPTGILTYTNSPNWPNTVLKSASVAIGSNPPTKICYEIPREKI